MRIATPFHLFRFEPQRCQEFGRTYPLIKLLKCRLNGALACPSQTPLTCSRKLFRFKKVIKRCGNSRLESYLIPALEQTSVKKFTDLLAGAKRILVFTGAGISTASGIPDFRGPQGVWKRRRPVYYQDFLQSEEERIEHWDYKLEGFKAFQSARPNAAHLSLVDLERLGLLEALVTQNIDGLHETAGNSREKIIELHGTNRWIECLKCSNRYDPDPIFERFSKNRRCPLCSCGGFLKTATVMFGQPMPQDKMEQACAAAQRADLVVSVGSTLEVEPAASVPLLARSRNISYVIINRGPTAHDPFATLRFEGDLTEILPAAISDLKMNPDE